MNESLVLLQAFDPAHLLKRRIAERSSKLDADALGALRANAERELALVFCFGGTVALPVSYLTDSPIFLDVFRRLHEGYEPHNARIRSTFNELDHSWRPLAVTLEEKFHDLSDIASQYKWAPARFAAFEGLPVENQAELVIALSAALGVRDFKRAAEISGNAQHEDAYQRLGAYFTADANLRPTFEAQVDYAAYMESQIKRLSATGYEVQAGEITRRLGELYQMLGAHPAAKDMNIDGRTAASVYRGAWYVFSDVFESYWPSVGGILDNLNVTKFMYQYGISDGNFINPIYDAKVDWNRQGPEIDGDTGVVPTRIPQTVDWKKFWYSFSDAMFIRRVILTRQKLETSEDHNERQALIAEHAELIVDQIQGVGFEYADIISATGDRQSAFRAGHRLIKNATDVASVTLSFLAVASGLGILGLASTIANTEKSKESMSKLLAKGIAKDLPFWRNGKYLKVDRNGSYTSLIQHDADRAKNRDIADIIQRVNKADRSDIQLTAFIRAEANNRDEID